jgi:hypothetical protein
LLPPPPTDPYVSNSLIRFVSDGPCGPKTLQLTTPQGVMTVAAHPRRKPLRPDCCAIRARFVEAVCGLKVPPAFPWRRRHARHCLPALLRVLSWVPWALVPHASGQGFRPAPRYCALLRLPSSIPVGPLLAPFRYLGLTRIALCPSRLASGLVRLLAASASKRQGVGGAGHPHSGCCSQGDGRLSRVPGLPICPHAPLSDPGGVPPARLGADRTAALRSLDAVGFGSGCPDLSCCPPLYSFRSSMTRPVFSPYLCFAHRFSAIALRFGCRPGG